MAVHERRMPIDVNHDAANEHDGRKIPIMKFQLALVERMIEAVAFHLRHIIYGTDQHTNNTCEERNDLSDLFKQRGMVERYDYNEGQTRWRPQKLGYWRGG